jgi:hypothetical protein
MKIKIENRNTEVQLTFTPAEYFLVHSKDKRYGDDEMVWTLNPRIDRSSKGKDDDIGVPIVYLDDEEAETFKKAGFSWIEMG